MKPTLTMRYGAAHNEIVVDGIPYDRNEIPRDKFGRFRRIILGALEKTGYFNKNKR